MGIDTSPVIAGGAITGLTLGFAVREVTANYVSGVMLLVNRPFERGDYIVLGRPADDLAGVVEKTDLRYVYLRRAQMQPIGTPGPRMLTRTLLVPNSVIYKSVVAVFDHPPPEASLSPPSSSSPPPAKDTETSTQPKGKETHTNRAGESVSLWRNPAPPIPPKPRMGTNFE
jgi:hypothetical protein